MSGNTITSEVTGKVWKVLSTAGSRVEQGDTILVVESMKMEIPIEAEVGGVIDEFFVKEGDDIAEGQAVVSLRPASAG